MAGLRITQRRSAIGRKPAQRRTLKALGLRRIGHTVVREDTPDTRGMLFTVKHLVDVQDAASAAPSQDAASAASEQEEGT